MPPVGVPTASQRYCRYSPLGMLDRSEDFLVSYAQSKDKVKILLFSKVLSTDLAQPLYYIGYQFYSLCCLFRQLNFR